MQRWLERHLWCRQPTGDAAPVERSPTQQRAAEQAARHLLLYQCNECLYCLRVCRAMQRLNIPIALRDIHVDENAYRELIAGGGRTTVPCLRIDDHGRHLWLYGSAAIIRYLDRRFGLL